LSEYVPVGIAHGLEPLSEAFFHARREVC
jgi:hypothetical protein